MSADLPQPAEAGTTQQLEPEQVRSIARGAVCMCGQHQPDYVVHSGCATMECCGAEYHVQILSTGQVILSRLTPMIGDEAAVQTTGLRPQLPPPAQP